MDASDAPPPLSAADRVLLLAARAWGCEPVVALWDVFPPDRRRALRWAWENGAVGSLSQTAARDRLGEEREAQSRPDLARVHVSWWSRALKDESPSVRAAVANHAAPAVSEALRAELDLPRHERSPASRPDDRVLRTALALWADRLVGDLADRDDDPPAVWAVSRFDARTFTRLLHSTGLAKISLTPGDENALNPDEQTRVGLFRNALAAMDPRFRLQARVDVDEVGPGTEHAAARLGLVTVGRLLVSVDPYRVRWALQHLPSATARLLKSAMPPPGRENPMLARWEGELFRTAWESLHRDGRLPDPWRWGIPT